MSIVESTKVNQVDEVRPTLVERSSVKLLVSIEDKPYFHWQLPILAESLCNKIPQCWEFLVVVLNNHGPLSEALTQVLTAYNLTYFTDTNPGANQAIDFSYSPKGYLGWNKIQALSAVSDYVNNDDLVYLMDTDIFVFQDLNFDILPTGNALCENWLIKNEPFLSNPEDPKGVNLRGLLDALGCPQPFQPGGVFVCLTGETIKNAKFVQDCFRFTQILFLAGRIMDFKDKVWMAEMPCFALALTANDIPYDLINPPELGVDCHYHEVISPGSFYHYYRKRMADHPGAFYESPWCKHDYCNTNFLEADLDRFHDEARTEPEKYFFELAKIAKQKLGLCGVSVQPPVLSNTKSQNGHLSEERDDQQIPDKIISSQHVQIEDFLTTSELNRLQSYAIQHREALIAASPSHNGTDSCPPELHITFRDTEIGGLVINQIRQVLPDILAQFEMASFPIKDIEAELSASRNGALGKIQHDRGTQQTESRELTFLFSFYHYPLPSSGRELLLYHLKENDGVKVRADSCTTLELKANSMVVFPSHCSYEIRATQGGSEALDDHGFILKGWVRRQRKRLPPTQMPESILEWAKIFQGQQSQKNDEPVAR